MNLGKFFLSPPGKLFAVIIGLTLYYLVFVFPANTLASYLGYPLVDDLMSAPFHAYELIIWFALLAPILGRFFYQKFKNVASRHFMALTMTWAGVGFFLFFPTLILKALNALFSFEQNTLFTITVIFLVLIGVISLLGIINASLLFVKKIQIKDARITQASTAIQLSDVHIGSRSKVYIKKLVSRVNKINADKVFITGDLVDLSAVNESDLAILKSINSPVYFVTGNHDRYVSLDRLLPILERQDFIILRNETLQLDHFDLTGIDDAESPRQVERVLEKISLNSERFNILLYHRPQGFEAATAKGVDLMLSGHTHNGQIVPFNFMVKQVFNDIKGTIKRGGAILHVSTGTSTWGPIMRIGSVNEITLISLEPV